MMRKEEDGLEKQVKRSTFDLERSGLRIKQTKSTLATWSRLQESLHNDSAKEKKKKKKIQQNPSSMVLMALKKIMSLGPVVHFSNECLPSLPRVRPCAGCWEDRHYLPFKQSSLVASRKEVVITASGALMEGS